MLKGLYNKITGERRYRVMTQFVNDDLLGKIGEMQVMQELNSDIIYTMNRETGTCWQTTHIFHIDKTPEGRHEGIVAYLQERGGDIIQLEREMQQQKGTNELKATGRQRITLHEVKTQPGTFGIYNGGSPTSNLPGAIEIIEEFRSNHGVVAGTGNVVIEIYGKNAGEHTPEKLEALRKAPDPFNIPAGWYWKYKKVLEQLPEDNKDTEYRFMIWFYLLQAKKTPSYRGGGTRQNELEENKPAMLINISVKRLIEVVEEKLKSNNKSDWKWGNNREQILVIPLYELLPKERDAITHLIVKDSRIKSCEFGKKVEKTVESYEKTIDDFKIQNPETGEISYKIPIQNFISGKRDRKVIDRPHFGYDEEEAKKINCFDKNGDKLNESYEFYHFYHKVFKISIGSGVTNHTTTKAEDLKMLTELLREHRIVPDDV